MRLSKINSHIIFNQLPLKKANPPKGGDAKPTGLKLLQAMAAGLPGLFVPAIPAVLHFSKKDH
jgi:hypothetical protein